MQCPNCKSKVSKKAKFCPECGKPITDKTNITVKQEIGKVKGTLVGQALDNDKLPAGLKSTTAQKVDSVEAGGIVVGATIGDAPQIGGQRQYGDRVTVGKISGSSGVALGKNVNVKITQGASAEEIARAFSTLLQAVQAKSESPEKAMAQTAVQGLEAEAAKGEDADEGKVQKWVDFLGEMAPDIWEVAVDTFTNPIKGVSTVFKKVAERAKAEKRT
jgi:hypothetical protein